MSILIKGMEMPKDCLKCPFCLFADGYWKCLVDGSHADFGGTCRPQNCPLRPVPAHGRMIDADALIRELEITEEDDHNGATLLMAVFLEVLKSAPTVIPAEEEP